MGQIEMFNQFLYLKPFNFERTNEFVKKIGTYKQFIYKLYIYVCVCVCVCVIEIFVSLTEWENKYKTIWKEKKTKILTSGHVFPIIALSNGIKSKRKKGKCLTYVVISNNAKCFHYVMQPFHFRRWFHRPKMVLIEPNQIFIQLY